MAAIPKKVADRISENLKPLQKLIGESSARSDNEADTVRVVTAILTDLFGYKFDEIVSQVRLGHDACDLGLKVDESLQVLIEVKHVNAELKDVHVSKAVSYASKSETVDWAVLTNSRNWRIYYVKNDKPVSEELVAEFDFTELVAKSEDDCELIYMLCHEGWSKSALEDFQQRKQVVNRFMVYAALLSDESLRATVRAIKRVDNDFSISTDEVRGIIENEIVKRDLLDDPRYEPAQRKIKNASDKPLKES